MKKKVIVNALFFTIMIIIFIIFHKSTSNSENNRYYHGKFAIGYFLKYSPSSPGASSGCHYYFYNDEGKRRSSMQRRGQPNQSEITKIKEGDRYLVIYNDNGSDLLLDHPIKDSTDFKQHVKKFIELRNEKDK